VLPDGTPVSVAKRFLRQYEADPAGYSSAWGYKGGLPSGLPVDEHGFPVFEGKPIGSQYYGGRYAGQVSHAAGMYQWQPSTWRDAVTAMAKDGIEIKDFSPESQEKVATYMLERQGLGTAWLPFNSKLTAAYNQYKQSGQEPRFTGPLAYWEQGYTGGSGSSGGRGGSTPKLPGGPIPLEVNAPSSTESPRGHSIYETQGPDLSPGSLGADLRRGMLFSMLGKMMQGVKFTPVDYDPFKVEQTKGAPDPVPVRIDSTPNIIPVPRGAAHVPNMPVGRQSSPYTVSIGGGG
jgi:hypothetical protein